MESAQTRIEGFNFDARKQVLAYDDVLNQQRMIAYARRQKLLKGDQEEIQSILQEVAELDEDTAKAIQTKKQEFGEVEFMSMFQRLALQMFDTLWVEHLEVMSHTRSSVNLRAYGQRDPLVEYRKEGTQLFEQMQRTVLTRIAEVLPRVQPAIIEQAEIEHQKQAAAALLASKLDAMKTEGANNKPRVSENVPGRNDVVIVTNGSETKQLKYKKAEALLASGWKIK